MTSKHQKTNPISIRALAPARKCGGFQHTKCVEKTNPIPGSPHPAPGCADILITTKNQCPKITQNPKKFAKNKKKSKKTPPNQAFQ